MKKNLIYYLIFLYSLKSFSQNPIIRNQFTADPSAHVFNGRVYVYPSHDIPVPEGKGLRKDWFCMEDYHVFSSHNLIDWVDHGVILTQYQVPWVDSTTFSFWAPDCIEKNGKYFFYFPALSLEKDSTGRKLFRIGVAIADKPEGPFTPLSEPIKGVVGIDPCVFIDKDGQAYLYWSLGNIYVAKLKENMTELATEPQIIANLPEKGLKEGPWVFHRNGIYYLTFPHVENQIERLEYAMGNNPMGPFKMAGVIMDESPMKCWTNHHSIIEYNNQWYLFYHQNALSPHFDKNRSICIDSLFFNADGTIQKVVPTNRGVGLSDPSKPIQIDRYSAISAKGVQIHFIDSLNPFEGWKASFSLNQAWLRYNNVDFANLKHQKITIRIRSLTGGKVDIYIANNKTTKKLKRIKVPKMRDWVLLSYKLAMSPSGISDLILKQSGEGFFEIDWIRFDSVGHHY
ncbi:MAG: family 43 glycosylhydrolase [Bacteroidales bacterium]|nr:family 43 glycosylhydrolase [Bacteroidales bacterium]